MSMARFFELISDICYLLYQLLPISVSILLRLKDIIFGTKKKSIKDALVLITGAGSGIGQLLAVEMAKLGAKIALVDISTKGLDETESLIESIGSKCLKFKCDVTDENAIYRIANEIKITENRHVNILVNNAGIVSDNRPIEEKDEERVRLSFNVNAVSHFYTIKAFLPEMIKHGDGHVVTIASIMGLMSSTCFSDYVSSKFAAVGVHESLTCEMFERRLHNEIKTTLVCPYKIDTGMFDGVGENKINSIVPIITPEHAVERILNGILRNEPEVFIPRTLLYLYWSKALFPTATSLGLSYRTGLISLMRQFTGRQS